MLSGYVAWVCIIAFLVFASVSKGGLFYSRFFSIYFVAVFRHRIFFSLFLASTSTIQGFPGLMG